MKPSAVLPCMMLLISGLTRQCPADDPLPPGLDHAIRNSNIPMIADVTIVKFNKAGHGVIRVNRIYRPTPDGKGVSTTVPKVVRGYGYEGSDRVAPLRIVTGRGQTRFLMFLDGDLLYSTYNNRFPIREGKCGRLEVGTGFNGSGAPWRPLSEITRLIPGPAAGAGLPVDPAGTKVLVAFDPRGLRTGAARKFEQGLKNGEVLVLHRYGRGACLILDCGKKDPVSVLAGVPSHAGAIVFQDGRFVRAIASHDNRRIPGNHAILRRGGSAAEMALMEKDFEKVSQIDGVVVQKISDVPGQSKPPAGHPWYLKLTPGKGRTLLEIFLLTEARFAYSGVNSKARPQQKQQ